MVDFPSYPPSRPLVLPRRLLWGVGGEAFADMIRDDKVVKTWLFFDDFLVDLLWFSSIFFDFLCFSRIFSCQVSSNVESGNPMKSERKKAMEVYRWEHGIWLKMTCLTKWNRLNPTTESRNSPSTTWRRFFGNSGNWELKNLSIKEQPLTTNIE